MKTTKWVPVFCVLVLLSTPAIATEFVVDPGGSGDALTIQAGLDLASAGDLVTVLAGTYAENITMVSGVELVGASGSGSTIIDGNGDICINCEQCGLGTRISGFTLTNGGGYTGCGIRVFDHSSVEIDNNKFLENHSDFEGAGITVQRYSSADIHDNRFIRNTSFKTCAITVIVGSQATIAKNFFKGNVSTDYAGVIGANDSNVIIEWNRIVENRSGSYAGTIDIVTSFCQLRNNTFIRNLAPVGGSCLRDGGWSIITVANNLFAHNGGGGPAVKAEDCQNFSCNIFWDNGIDYLGDCNPIGQNNNAHISSLVCNPAEDSCAVSEFSPCLGGPCGLIGVNATPDCTDDVVSVETESWGSLKSLFR